MDNSEIIIKGLRQNNLKNISLRIPKNKIVVFAGVSGSGKSSIVFDTVAAESQRQMNETYTAWIRGRLPKFEKPKVDFIDQLNPSVGPASYFSFNNPNGMCAACAGIGKVMELDMEKLIDPDKSFEEGMLQLPALGPGKYYWRVYHRPDLFGVKKKWRDYTEKEKNILLYGSETHDGERLDKKFEGVKNQFERLCLMKGTEGQTDNTLKRINAFMKEKTCPSCQGRRLNERALSSKVLGYDIQEMCEMEFQELREVLKCMEDPSGKSSLIRDVFAKQYEEQTVLVDQSAITATGRSTACTFLGFFDEIRALLAKENHEDKTLFSFNSRGACPICKGRGMITTELVFMDPVTTVCEACEGKRYSKEVLDKTYHGKNIVEILSMSVKEARSFFGESKKICKQLDALLQTGLPYLSLGQPLSILSGGECQRVKLAKELGRKGSVFVLDEPTTGLHASDIDKIMELLDGFVERGNTVLVIEHNTDVMKMADYIIDVGPDGGTVGGEIVFEGTPEEMITRAHTITVDYLRRAL